MRAADPCMAAALATYTTKVSGLWTPIHVLSNAEGPIGTLTTARKGLLMASGTFKPIKGEVLHLRRDPGILRSQFSLWTENREWLGSSLRWSFFGSREIALSTGNKPYRLLPVTGLRLGWHMYAPKTGEMARITRSIGSRDATIEVYRRVDLELVVFSYFLVSQIWWESLWPGRAVADDLDSIPAPEKA
jgi:hypothetical protein